MSSGISTMNTIEKRKAYVERLVELGVKERGTVPWLYRVLWKIGVDVPPPLYGSFLQQLLMFGIPAGLFWGISMRILVWSERPILVPVLGAVFFGFWMSVWIWFLLRRTRRKLGLCEEWADFVKEEREVKNEISEIYLERNGSKEELLAAIRGGIDLLAAQKYDEFIKRFGYSLPGGEASADWIVEDLARYRSELFPGVEKFEVTDWRTAEGGNPNPCQDVIWYQPNDSGLAGAVKFHLPLNGQWSDLAADFVLFETNAEEGYLLRLEEIC